jgi:hypothetical protein
MYEGTRVWRIARVLPEIPEAYKLYGISENKTTPYTTAPTGTCITEWIILHIDVSFVILLPVRRQIYNNFLLTRTGNGALSAPNGAKPTLYALLKIGSLQSKAS